MKKIEINKIENDIPRTDGPHAQRLEAVEDWWEQPAGYKDAPTQINTQSIKDATGSLARTCVSSDRRDKRTQARVETVKQAIIRDLSAFGTSWAMHLKSESLSKASK